MNKVIWIFKDGVGWVEKERKKEMEGGEERKKGRKDDAESWVY